MEEERFENWGELAEELKYLILLSVAPNDIANLLNANISNLTTSLSFQRDYSEKHFSVDSFTYQKSHNLQLLQYINQIPQRTSPSELYLEHFADLGCLNYIQTPSQFEKDFGIKIKDKKYRKSLYYAAKSGNLETMKHILSIKGANDLLMRAGWHRTPYLVACAENQYEIVEYLLENYSDPPTFRLMDENYDESGEGDLYLAASRGNKELLELLLKDKYLEPLLKEGNFDSIEKYKKWAINSSNNGHGLYLVHTLVKNQRFNILEYLIPMGLNLNVATSNYYHESNEYYFQSREFGTPLMMCSCPKNFREETIRFLINNAADPFCKCSNMNVFEYLEYWKKSLPAASKIVDKALRVIIDAYRNYISEDKWLEVESEILPYIPDNDS